MIFRSSNTHDSGAQDRVSGIYQPVLFAGQYADVETTAWSNDGVTVHRPGLVLNGYRTYDPFTGAYCQLDPRVDETWKSYLYAGGNPIGKGDPLGLEETDSAPGSGSGEWSCTSTSTKKDGKETIEVKCTWVDDAVDPVIGSWDDYMPPLSDDPFGWYTGDSGPNNIPQPGTPSDQATRICDMHCNDECNSKDNVLTMGCASALGFQLKDKLASPTETWPNGQNPHNLGMHSPIGVFGSYYYGSPGENHLPPLPQRVSDSFECLNSVEDQRKNCYTLCYVQCMAQSGN